MKRLTALIFALVLLAVAAAVIILAFSAQDGDQMGNSTLRTEWDPHTPLGAETEMRIKQDFLEFHTKPISRDPDATVDDVEILEYYGTNNICIAVMMTDRFTGYLTVVVSETVDGMTFYYGSSNRMLIWADGKFHHLQEAYDKGLLNKEDLKGMGGIENGPPAFEIVKL